MGTDGIGGFDQQLDGARARSKRLKISDAQDFESYLDVLETFSSNEKIPEPLKQYFIRGSSLGGARPKASVKYKGEMYIAKFSRADDSFDVPKVEYMTMTLAALVGLNVPPLDLVTARGKSVFLIKRFDRYKTSRSNNPFYYRRHGISALTGIQAHESDYGSNARSYSELDLFIRQNANDHNKDRKELFQRMVFNVLLANTDDHLKNHVFLYNEEKATFDLSPLFDVMPIVGDTASNKKLYLLIGDEGRAATLANLRTAYKHFPGSTEEQANIWIEQTLQGCLQFFHQACDQAGLTEFEKSSLISSLPELSQYLS